MDYVVRNGELYHYGVLGMKWGKRRYQNSDGSLTSAGQKRYDRDKRENAGKQKGDRVGAADPDRWVREDLSRTRKLTDETSGLIDKTKRTIDNSVKNNPKKKMDLSKMTDQEMRSQINRELLERQYNDMFAPKKSTKGREYVSKVLEGTGTALGITGSALGIALAIKELKG